ncbi:MAG: FkbM family methyltransferase [Verrucomicrobia bacterium]|nr:FkbM family methyltransferase [Verrucomicrobiota bacterium]
MITNTKTLFAALLKLFRVDGVCDIGSCDGSQALLFRDVRPEARIFAFEANPLNYEAMRRQPRLGERRIEVVPCAISNADGTANFHVTDVDYSAQDANKGTSSLLVRTDLAVREVVEVRTRRLDRFIEEHAPEVQRLGLWIDVEGAEYGVLEGMAGIQERVMAVHVETARVPLRQGQKPLADVTQLLGSYGLTPCGSNLRPGSDWGDVVFVRRRAAAATGWGYRLALLKGRLGVWGRADHLAVFLKARFPAGYRVLRRLYVKLGM